MKAIRIAQVCGLYYPSIGGIEMHVKSLSERLVKRGFDVNVICADSSGKLIGRQEIDGVKVTRFKTFLTPENKYHFSPGLYFFLKHQNFDLIHAHNYHSLPSLFASLAKKGRKFIFTPHYHSKRNLLHLLYKPMGSTTFRKADKVICVSRYEMKHLMERFKIPESKLIIIPSGLNLEEFDNIEPTFTNDREGILLFVGRLERYKGVQYILRALQGLNNYRLIIIGKGPYENDLRKLAHRLKASDHVSWLKNLPQIDLLRYYKSANIFLTLSRHEAYGSAVAEALASGTPCIVAKGSALEDFIDGKSCVGLDYPINVKELRNLIIRLGSKDKDEVNVKLKSWDEVTEEILKKAYELPLT